MATQSTEGTMENEDKEPKLFVCYINTKKSQDVRPGEQAIIVAAVSKENALLQVKDCMRLDATLKTDWPIGVVEANWVLALEKDISLHEYCLRENAAAGK